MLATIGIAPSSTLFEVIGPKPCSTTAAELDTVCGSVVAVPLVVLAWFVIRHPLAASAKA